MPMLAPSILSADFARLAEEIRAVEEAGADWIHVDVMDGHFVPNLTIGAPVAAAIRPVTGLPMDCHLMVTNPDSYLEAFAKAGADWLSVHAEACTHLQRTLSRIRDLGMKAGVALNPHTPPEMIQYVIPDLDFVLVMSVNPGFGGQSFIPSSLTKIRRLAAMLREAGSEALIQVDGGISASTIAEVYAAGARVFVSGSAVFGHPLGYRAAMEEMRRLARGA